MFFCLAYCEHGYWGDTCQNCCTCAINATLGIRTSECDQSNGNCHCSYPKYKGPNCDEEVEPCPRGTFNIHGRKEGKCSMCPVSYTLNIFQFPVIPDSNCKTMTLFILIYLV